MNKAMSIQCTTVYQNHERYIEITATKEGANVTLYLTLYCHFRTKWIIDLFQSFNVPFELGYSLDRIKRE